MQKKLLDLALLTPKELDWLDDYHNTVRRQLDFAVRVGSVMQLLHTHATYGDLNVWFCHQVWTKLHKLVEEKEALAWLKEATAPVTRQ